MYFERATSVGGKVAECTFERFLSCVSSRMLIQVVLAHVFFVTHITSKRSAARMAPQVDDKFTA